MDAEQVARKIGNPKKVGNGQWKARCPCHDDDVPSLNVTDSKGKVLLYCHVCGAKAEDVVNKVSELSMSDLSPDSPKLVAAYDYRDENHKLLYQSCRFEPGKYGEKKGFYQRDANGIWKTKGIRKVLYRLPELLAADPAQVVFVVEGEKDADNLASRGLVSTTNVGGASTGKYQSKWLPQYSESLRGRHVVILPDNDDAGRKHAENVAQSLRGIAASVKVVELPRLRAKGDVSDWLAAGGMKDALLAMAAAAPEWQPTLTEEAPVESVPLAAEKPVIEVGPDELRVTDEACAALSKCPNVFQRGGVLVEVREAPECPPNIYRPEGGIRAVQLPKPSLRERLAESANFVRHTAKGQRRCSVPDTCVSQVAVRGLWKGIRPLEGIVSSPQFLRDGSVLTKLGYDPGSGLYFASDIVFPPVGPSPDLNDAKRAAEELLEIVTDFPMDENSIAAFIALVLTGASRFAIDGPVPLGAVDANTRGSGKTMLVDAVGTIHTGRALPRTTVSEEDAEMRKRITATLRAGEPIVLLDNVSSTLGSPAIDALLTSTTWNDRILGMSEMTGALPCRTIWIATGNNMQFQADTARRTLRIRLESNLENPEERSGFKHADLLGWVREHRARLAVAAVTILRAWHLAGRQQSGIKPWGSFESWSQIVRAAVVWVGLADPGNTRQETQQHADQNRALLRRLIEGWEDGVAELRKIDTQRVGMTVSEAIEKSQHGLSIPLFGVLGELAGTSGKPNAVGIGKKLQHYRRSICSGKYLDTKPGSRGVQLWYVANVSTP